MNAKELKSYLIRMVEMSRTNAKAADYLEIALGQATDWRERQHIQAAIRCALANAVKIGA